MPNVFGSISTPESCSSTAEPIGCFLPLTLKVKPAEKAFSLSSKGAQNEESPLDLAFKALTTPPLVLSFRAAVDSTVMLVRENGFPRVTRVRYHVQYSQFAAYRSLAENCLYNGTLPLGQRCEAAQD